MATIAVIMGSILGFFGAVLGWLFWDMSVLSAFGFYLATSISCAVLAMAMAVSRDDDMGAAYPANAMNN